jgi:uncharacterized repeat protein (TIGR01451 family)
MQRLRAWQAAGMAAGLSAVLLGAMLAPARASGTFPAADADAALAVSASVSPSPQVIGDPAVYTVTVSNTGGAAATNVTTTLPFEPPGGLTFGALPAGCVASGQTVTCTAATVPAGGSVIYQIPVTVAPSLSDGTNLVLRARASATGVPAATTDLITQAFTRVDVEIDKSGPATVDAGGTITYTITVTNHGPSNAATVTWHDPMNGNQVTIDGYPCGDTGLTVSCSVGTMAPGETRTFTITATVKPDLPDGTVITNCAVVYTGTSPETNLDNNQSCLDTTVAPAADVEVTKAGPATVQAGGTMEYTVTETNHGPDEATGVILTDPLDESLLTVVSLPTGCTDASGTIVCLVGTLGVGESKSFTFTVKVADSAPAGTEIDNCATVSSPGVDLRTSGETACVETTVLVSASADVEIVKSGPPVALPGGTITYTLTATNHGPDAADNVTVTDPADTSLVTVTAAPGCTVAAGVVTCPVGTLAAGDSRTFTVTAVVNAGVTTAFIRDCAQAYTSTLDTDTINNQSCVTTVVGPLGGGRSVIRVAKDGPAIAHAGGSITYTVKVTNLGPSAAPNVVFTDPFDPALTVISAPSECTVQHNTAVCLLGSLGVGKSTTLTFTVRVAGAVKPGTLVDNCASATSSLVRVSSTGDRSCTQTVILARPSAHVAIAKTGPPVVHPDGTVTYKLKVTDHGPDAARNVVVKDPVDPALVTITSVPRECTVAADTVTCQLGTLSPGESKDLTFAARVNHHVSPITFIGNCASVYTTTPDPDPSDHQSCVTTVVVPPADPVVVVKNGPAAITAGGTFRYTITVTNRSSAAVNTIVLDPVNPAVTVTSLPNGCTLRHNAVTCGPRTLQPGQSKTFHFTVMIAADTPPGTNIMNCAAAISTLTSVLTAGDLFCAQAQVLTVVPVTG